tara:strand:- start:175 stop:579 length:405 start_codon:yes stop_codon:yes gene_type:complete
MENFEKRQAARDAELMTANVGDGATYTSYTDRHAGTIIKRTEKTITWQRDKATLLNGRNSDESDALEFFPGGFVGHTTGRQRYEYERDTAGEVKKFTLRTLKNGRQIWKRAGVRTNERGGTLDVGRAEHYDFNF